MDICRTLESEYIQLCLQLSHTKWVWIQKDWLGWVDLPWSHSLYGSSSSRWKAWEPGKVSRVICTRFIQSQDSNEINSIRNYWKCIHLRFSVCFLSTNITQTGTRALIQGERMVRLAPPHPPLTHVTSISLLCTLHPQVLLLLDMWSLSPHASRPGEKWGMKELSQRLSLWKNPWNKIRSFVVNLMLPYLLCLISKDFLFLSLELHFKREYSLVLIKPRGGAWQVGQWRDPENLWRCAGWALLHGALMSQTHQIFPRNNRKWLGYEYSLKWLCGWMIGSQSHTHLQTGQVVREELKRVSEPTKSMGMEGYSMFSSPFLWAACSK